MFPVAQVRLLTGRLVLERIPVLQESHPGVQGENPSSPCLPRICHLSAYTQVPEEAGIGLWAREGRGGDALRMTQ